MLAALPRKAVPAMANVAFRAKRPPPEEDESELALHALKVESTKW